MGAQALRLYLAEYLGGMETFCQTKGFQLLFLTDIIRFLMNVCSKDAFK